MRGDLVAKSTELLAQPVKVKAKEPETLPSSLRGENLRLIASMGLEHWNTKHRHHSISGFEVVGLLNLPKACFLRLSYLGKRLWHSSQYACPKCVSPRVYPRSVPCGPVERGFVQRVHCPETEQSAADGVGLRQTYLPRLAEVLKALNTSRQSSDTP